MAAADRHDDSKRGVCGRGADGRTAPARDRRAWRQAQADRRAAGHQLSCGYGVASTDRRTGQRGSRRRADRGRGRPGLFQDRGHRGLREGRDRPLRAAATARSLG